MVFALLFGGFFQWLDGGGVQDDEEFDMAGVSLREVVAEMRQGLQAELMPLHRRLDAIETHLRDLNGRTRKVEQDVIRNDQRLINLETGRHRRRDDPEDEDHLSERTQRSGDRPITERQGKFFLAILAGMGSLIVFLMQVWPAVKRMLGLP